MKSRSNKSIVNQINRCRLLFGLPAVVLIAVLIATLSVCSPVSAETYEYDEYGQVYMGEPIISSPLKPEDVWSDKIADQMEKLNDRLARVAAKANDKKLDLLNEKQMKRLEKEVERSNKANQKLKADRVFKERGKPDKFKNKNGSTTNSDPLRYFKDPPPEDEYDLEELEHFSELIEDMNSLMGETEDELDFRILVAAQKMEISRMETASLDTSGAYAELTTLLENSPAVDGWYITVKVCKIASLTTAMLADVADCFTKQTVAGFSLSMLNSPLMAAAGALEIISESFQIVVETKEGELSEASYKCIVQIGIEHTEMATDLTNISGNLIQIQADVNSVGGGVDVLALQLEATDAKVDYLVTKTDTIDLKVDTLTQKVDALSLQVAEMNRQMNEQFETMTALLNQRFNSVETLLNTPHGLRPNFPKK